MPFSSLPTEIRHQILWDYLSTYALPANLISPPPSGAPPLTIYPRQPPLEFVLQIAGGVSIRVHRSIRDVQKFWGGTRMASLFTVNRQFSIDLAELIYRRATFLLPLSHARCLHELPPWVQSLSIPIASSIRHLDLTLEIMRYNGDSDRRAALLTDCNVVRMRFPGLESLILRTFSLQGSIEGVFDKDWDPKFGDYLDHIGAALDIFSGIPKISLWVREEHSTLPQGDHDRFYRGEGTWMTFERCERGYRRHHAGGMTVASSLSNLWDPEVVRKKHAWVYPIPKYPMMHPDPRGRWVWNLGLESEHFYIPRKQQ